jgi:hypothetical protein
MTYAAKTVVSVERTKAELDALLAAHGAGQRGIMQDDEHGRAVVVFGLGGRHYKLSIPVPGPVEFPDPAKYDYEQKGVAAPKSIGWNRWTEGQRRAWVDRQREQATRSRWRAVLLLVKAKLEAIALGTSTAEREFFADLVLPNGRTVHASLAGDIATAYGTGKMPPLLLGVGGES